MLEQVQIPIELIDEPPYNPRRGNVEVIKMSLKAHGQYRSVVGRRVGDRYQCLAGNHTVKAARELGMEAISMELGEYDDDQAEKILAIDNRANDLAENDNEKLSALLQGMTDLEGTGYNVDDVEELKRLTGQLADEAMSALERALGERPDFEHPPSEKPRYNFMVSFSVTVERRAAIMACLRHMIGEDENLENSNDAIAKLCEAYNEAHGVGVELPKLEEAGAR